MPKKKTPITESFIEPIKPIELTKEFKEPTQKSSTDTKYFLFKCGPTGSGKSNVEQIVDNYLTAKKEIKTKLFTHKDTVNLSIDDLVERNPYFKEGVDRIFKKLFDRHKRKLKQEVKTKEVVFEKTRKEKVKTIDSITTDRITKVIIELFDNPGKDIIDELNVIYENARIRTSCIKGDEGKRITRRTVNTIKDSCENIRDQLLEKALKQNKNIVFERTGKDFPTKLFTKFPKILAEYNVIFSWSVVNVCELLHRNKERVISKLEQYFKIKDKSPIKYKDQNSFLESKILPIPRLPDTDEIKYKKALFEIINTFNIYFYKKNNYRQLIIDNNYDSLVVYDNKYNNPTNKSNPMSRYNIDQYCE